jgi:hypothetical protein
VIVRVKQNEENVMNMNRISVKGLVASGILAVTVVVVAIALNRPARAALAQWVPAAGPPPLEFWDFSTNGNPFRTVSGAYAAQVEPNCLLRTVTVHWKHLPTNTIAQEVLPVSYWPTAACKTRAPLSFCVAGKRDSAGKNTVIEQWTMKEPLLIISSPSAPPIVVPQGARSKSTAYDDAVQGRDMVRTMQTMCDVTSSAANSIVIKFWDSNDVCTLDLTVQQPAPVLVASPSGGSGLLVPELLSYHSVFYRMDHAFHGYCYHLTNTSRSGVAVVLTDGNRDGVIDGYVPVADVYDWDNNGFADATTYLPLQ